MDDITVRALARLNNDFYRENAASFSATRQRGWDGWNRVTASIMNGRSTGSGNCRRPLRVLDAACGNLRYERFVNGRYGASGVTFTCIDSTAELLGDIPGNVTFEKLDVIDRLLREGPLSQGRYDAAVSFGFMHHVPSNRLRRALLEGLLGCTGAGGTVAVSFWRFADEPKMAARAKETTEAGCKKLGLGLDGNDYLLGWNSQPGAYRYCHSFTDAEIEGLIASVTHLGTAQDRFDADGRNGALNSYVVIRKR